MPTNRLKRAAILSFSLPSKIMFYWLFGLFKNGLQFVKMYLRFFKIPLVLKCGTFVDRFLNPGW